MAHESSFSWHPRTYDDRLRLAAITDRIAKSWNPRGSDSRRPSYSPALPFTSAGRNRRKAKAKGRQTVAESGYAKSVLVSTDFGLAQHLGDSNVVVAEVDAVPELYDGGACSGRHQASLARRLRRSGGPRSRRQSELRAVDGRARHLERHNGHPLRRQEQLVRGICVLVLEDVRP